MCLPIVLTVGGETEFADGMTRRRMSSRQLKALIQTGHYRLQPELVAEAMLERPGVRAFLAREVDEAAARSVGRSLAGQARRRAAG
jgi:hypothetical protein